MIDVPREDSTPLTNFTALYLENPGSTPGEPAEAKESDKGDSGGGLKTAAIGGVVAGIIFFIIIVFLITFFIYRKR